MKIKICGITNSSDALACAATGVDMIGLNFYRRSPRYIAPDRARAIVQALPSSTQAVGIFVNAPIEEIRHIARETDIRVIQLHGSEPPEICADLVRDFEVMKALRIHSGFVSQRTSAYAMCTILLDAYDRKMLGGTGDVCDWEFARAARKFTTRLILAGGLNPKNVAKAIASVNPDGVDACSGLECVPGIKDHARVQQFVAAARKAETLE